LTLPKVKSERSHVWHLFVAKSENRDHIKSTLHKHNISFNINYPKALPFLAAYSYIGENPIDFKNAMTNAEKIISLPIYPELQEVKLDFICEVLTRS
jgi:dTDP-4-amino-4,6-dideoxygalactose transaminase